MKYPNEIETNFEGKRLKLFLKWTGVTSKINVTH